MVRPSVSMRSKVSTSPLAWRSIRTVKFLNGAPPSNVDRAAFIFQLPEAPSRPCSKQVAESSVYPTKPPMAHNAANGMETPTNRGLAGAEERSHHFESGAGT